MIDGGYQKSTAAGYQPVGEHPAMAENLFTRVKARMRERWPDRYPKPAQPTQRQIAALISVKQSSVAKWAAGGSVDMDNVKALAKKLDVCVEWLVSGRGPKFPTEPFMADGETAALLALWEELDAPMRHRALEILRAAFGGQAAHPKPAERPAVHESTAIYRGKRQ